MRLPWSVTSIPLTDSSVDVVVSFETIEHIGAHAAMMAELKRVLRPDGVLIISTPDKATYTDATGNTNPYHVKELYQQEFEALLAEHFQHSRMHGQKIGFGSIIAPITGAAPFFESTASSMATTSGLSEAMYLIAVASDNPEKISGMSGLFMQDVQGSEPVLKRVEFELAQWEKARLEVDPTLISEFKSIMDEVVVLKQNAFGSRLPLLKLLRHIISTRLLYRLAKSGKFSDRRRRKFLRSAEKRDPLLIGKQVNSFAVNLFSRLSSHPILAEHARRAVADLNITVTAIVPNYNHARFLRQRLDSILNQSYPLINVIVLDDCSTDDSRNVIDEYVALYPDRIKAVYNETNSGSVFAQWHKGRALATGKLIWICESDDFCDTDFIQQLIPSFVDASVMLAFGRISFVDEAGVEYPGMDAYREEAEAGLWGNPLVRPAFAWFRGGFGVKNVIANVGGSVWRNLALPEATWDGARDYQIMGDWFLYASLAQGGQIAYEPSARSWFRIHGKNTSGSAAQATPEYYREYSRLMIALKKRWPLPETTVNRFVASCREVYERANITKPSFDDLVSVAMLKAVETENLHVLIGLSGFSFGGGEIFPIHLANALRERGVMVSVVQMTTAHDHRDVRALLDSSIPVYTPDVIRAYGREQFLADAGVSIIHSHIASIEMLFVDEIRHSVPYVATLHGSYEAMKVASDRVAGWCRRVDQYVYTADRNLEPFEGLDVALEKFVKFRNAMPLDERPFSKTRADLGIAENAVVFTLVARGVADKGWPQAVQAFHKLSHSHPNTPMALLLVGEGEQVESARVLAVGSPNIYFLGYVTTIHGVYRISDVALVPTRYLGESFPLCLIQAMQEGVPAIATDVGEIKAMLLDEDMTTGLILPNVDDDDIYSNTLAEAMGVILDTDTRAKLAVNARALGSSFSIDALAGDYFSLYHRVIAARADSN